MTEAMKDANLTISNNRIIRDGKFTGWMLTRGSYTGTTDDRADRWYIEHQDATTVDRRGDGYATKQDALIDFGRTFN